MPSTGPRVTPPPRHIRCDAGLVQFQRVRLAGDSLSEERREVVQRALEAAGLAVDPGAPATIDLRLGARAPAEVAREVAHEYYELDLDNGGVRLRAEAWPGLLWGVRSLAQLVEQGRHGDPLPALRVRDWPALAHRGIFVEDKWGPDRMGLDDWHRAVDRLAALKLNRLGVGLYGCWGSCRYELGPNGQGWPTEFLMVPVPGYPQLRTPKRLRWYSPAAAAWRDETYVPRLAAEDFLAALVQYAAAAGVTVVPFVNSLGHNTFIPRVLPEIAARDAAGRPAGIGYCLSNPATRAFIESFYRSIVERYFGGRAPFFHVQLDEVWPDHPDPEDPFRRSEPWCQCAACRARPPEELLQDYVLWLVEMLTRHGVDQVVMWNDQLTRHMDALDAGFVGRLRDRGLDQRLIFDWWWYSNEELNDKTRVAIGRRLGLRGWVAPMTCYFNWQMYSPRLPNIELMLRMGLEEGGEGAVSYAVHDPGWTDHEALLAAYAWSGPSLPPWEPQVESWARGHFGAQADAYLEATARLRAAAAVPALGRCFAFSYSYVRPGAPFPRPYPEEALAALAAMADAPKQLDGAAALAAAAERGFAELSLAPAADRPLLGSLRGEAARIVGLARTFAWLLQLYRSQEALGPDRLESWGQMRAGLLAAMAQVEAGKPTYVAPACLQALSLLLAFLDQLGAELTHRTAAGSGGPEANAVPSRAGLHWGLVTPYAGAAADAG